MNKKKNRMVKEIEITVRFRGKNVVQSLYFEKDDEEQRLTEEEMYEYGFCGDITLEEEDGNEITLSLDASNPEFFCGTYINHLMFNIYPLNEPSEFYKEAEVINYKPIFYEDSEE